MNTVFNFHNAFKRSQLEIVSTVPNKLLWEFLEPYKKERLPESVTFEIAVGKKNYDIIRLFQSGEYFFSQKFIDVLSQYMDMSDKCYPIKVDGAEAQYYVIYNLDKYPFLNKNRASFDKEPSFYCGKEITAPLFGINDTRCFVVTEELKNALIKNKISNIEFTASFLCTKEEYKEWRKSRKKIGDSSPESVSMIHPHDS
jgi:hypothetical protein